MTLTKTQVDAIQKTGAVGAAFIKGVIFASLAMVALAIGFADTSSTFGEFVQVMHAPAVLQCIALGGAVFALGRFCVSPPLVLKSWFVKAREQRQGH